MDPPAKGIVVKIIHLHTSRVTEVLAELRFDYLELYFLKPGDSQKPH
jgi:hypothetical protein